MPLDADAASAAAAAALTVLNRGLIRSWLEGRAQRALARDHGRAIVEACRSAAETNSDLEITHDDRASGLRLKLRMQGPAEPQRRRGE